MIILGIDPGTLITGYGIIETHKDVITAISYDAIRNSSNTSMPERLELIFTVLNKIIEKYHPDECAIETAFYGKNAQSALKLGHARGVAMLSAVTHQVPTTEYSPREVKKSVVGNGTASKEQVQYMVKSLLKMKQTPKFYDITDALAVAICHHHRTLRTGKKYRDWKSFVKLHPEKITR